MLDIRYHTHAVYLFSIEGGGERMAELGRKLVKFFHGPGSIICVWSSRGLSLV